MTDADTIRNAEDLWRLVHLVQDTIGTDGRPLLLDAQTDSIMPPLARLRALADELEDYIGRLIINDSASARLIISYPDVCGGDLCLAGTRVPVWVLEQARRAGRSISDVLEDYPQLSPLDVVVAWSFARTHKREIDQQIRASKG